MSVILVVLIAVLNHMRGGGFGASILPGHPRFYAAPVVAFISFPFVGPLDAFFVGISYLIWSLAPWGRFYDLGRLQPSYSPTEEGWFEAGILKLAGNDHIAFTLRNAICLLPAALLMGPSVMLLAPLITVAYEIGWRITPTAPIRTGELITGALWGAAIIWTA